MIKNSSYTDIEKLLGKFDSFTGDYFALVTQSVDRHRLRVFDRHTGAVKNDFSSEKEDKFTCLTWGEINSSIINEKPALPPPKKKKRQSNSTTTIKILALGLQNGSIAIYSLTHGSVIKTLTGSHNVPVNDFVFTGDGKKGFSCAEDLIIVEWNIVEAREVSKWKADSKPVKKLAISHDGKKLLSAGHRIKMWNLDSKEIIKNFIGHASLITNLVFSAKDEVCISAAQNDRFINVWNCHEKSEGDGNLMALTLDANATNLSISASNTILAISEEGILSLFKNITFVLKGSSSTPRNKRNKRSVARTPDSILKVVSARENDVIIPIFAASFPEEEEQEVLIASGTTVKPLFEKVKFLNEDNSFLPEIILTRQPYTGFLVDESNVVAQNLKTTKKQYDESKVKVLGTTKIGSLVERDDETRVKLKSFEEKISKLEVKDQKTLSDIYTTSELKKVDANSLQYILVQALHSDDSEFLTKVLGQTKSDLIKNTARKLPTQYVIPFLEKMVDTFQSNPNANPILLEWTKQVLSIHMAYLMTVPNLIRKLSNFYQVLDTRVVSFNKLLNFHGRLDLVMQQISLRQQYAAERFSSEDTSNVARTTYVESADEGENGDGMKYTEYSNNDNKAAFSKTIDAMDDEDSDDDDDYLPPEDEDELVEDEDLEQENYAENHADDDSSSTVSSSSS